MLLKLRLKMIEVGYNYGKKEQCPLDKNCGQDQQEHILTCGAIHQDEPSDGEEISKELWFITFTLEKDDLHFTYYWWW